MVSKRPLSDKVTKHCFLSLPPTAIFVGFPPFKFTASKLPILARADPSAPFMKVNSYVK